MEAGRPELWSPAEGLDAADGWLERRAEILARWERWITGPRPVSGPLPDFEVHRPQRDPIALLVTFSPWEQGGLDRGWAVCRVSVAGQGIAWRAWSLSRALDGALDGFDADVPVVLAGHGPGAKAALLAAAYDERFATVIASSAGVLGSVPVRRFCERHFGEGVEPLTRRHPTWFAPGLRHFSGREHLLPTDAHELLSLIAPRRLLISCAVNDPKESATAVEEAVQAARDVYARLGAPDALALQWRDGAPDVDALLDWVEGGAPAGPHAPVVAKAEFALPEGVACRPATTLDGLEFEVIEPAGREPVGRVLWFPPLCPPSGYVGAWEDGVPLPVMLAEAGWQVACHEPAGTGSRLGEVGSFGRRIADALAVLDCAAEKSWLVAYGDGCEIALHIAREHPAVAGGVYVAPGPAARLLAPGAPAIVFDPEVDPTSRPGEVAAACEAAGATRVVLDDWHRLSADTRRRVLGALVEAGVERHRGEQGVLAPHAPQHG